MPDEIVSGTGETAAPPSAPSTPAPATPGVSAPSVATPQTPPVSATADDRSNWVPPHRLRETRESALREAQTQFEQKERGYQQRLDQIQSQLHALVGVQPPQNPEISAIRSQFSQLYPGLAELEERAADIKALMQRSGDLESQNAHYWQTYGRQTTDRLYERAQTALGAPLTDEAKRALHSSFVGFIQSSPELTERYSNDPTVVDDFMKVFTSSFIDPVRRVASTNVVARTGVALPQDTPSGAIQGTPNVKPANLDERAASAWALYQQTAKP